MAQVSKDNFTKLHSFSPAWHGLALIFAVSDCCGSTNLELKVIVFQNHSSESFLIYFPRIEKSMVMLCMSYLRPTVCTIFLGSFLFLLSPSHKWTATQTMNKNHISVDMRTKESKRRENTAMCTKTIQLLL